MAQRTPFNAAFIRKVLQGTERVVIAKMDKIALTFHRTVVYATPVDLGQARAGWTFTLNTIDTSYPERPVGGATLSPPASVPNRNANRIGDRYYIANFVPHIVYLNEGTSTQAPLKFVENSLRYAYEIVDRNS